MICCIVAIIIAFKVGFDLEAHVGDVITTFINTLINSWILLYIYYGSKSPRLPFHPKKTRVYVLKEYEEVLPKESQGRIQEGGPKEYSRKSTQEKWQM